MRKLVLIPSQASYAVDYGEESLRAQLSGGPSRTRLDFIGTVAAVNVSWNLPPTAFNYMQAFYRTASKHASEPFLIDLIIDQALLAEYTAKFVPGSYRVGNVRGLQTTVTAQLEVRPLPVDENADNATMDAYELYGDNVTTAFEALAKLVNVTAPNAIPGD